MSNRRTTELRTRIKSTDNGDMFGENDIESASSATGKGKPQKARRTNNNNNNTMMIGIAIIIFATFWFVLGGRYYHDNNSSTKFVGDDEERYEILPKPNGWEKYSFSKIHSHFNCKVHASDQAKPLHSQKQWEYMRNKYNEVVDATVKFNDIVPPTLGYTLNDTHSPPPYYAKFSPGMGRGVFATRHIKKGELVHDGVGSAVAFPDGLAWRKFVFSLPRKMACDIAEWSWHQKSTVKGDLRIFVDLTIAAFFNSGWDGHSNVRPKSSISLQFYAKDDIEKDAELLYDYNVYATNWKQVLA